MRRASKIWLVAAVAFILLGGAVFAATMTAVGWDFERLSGDMETDGVAVGDPFHSIVIRADSEDIRFLYAEDGAGRVEYTALEGYTVSATVSDGVLTVNVQDERPWYRKYINFDFASGKVNVYLPRTAYEALTVDAATGDVTLAEEFSFDSVDITVSTGTVTLLADADAVKIKGSTADVEVKDVSLGSLSVEVSTGDITLSSLRCRGAIDATVTTGKIQLRDVDCAGFTTAGDTGDLTVKDTTVVGALKVERSTGDVSLQNLLAITIEVETSTGKVAFASVDADTITVTTSTGDVRGSLCTAKIFSAQSSSGRVNVPESAAGGTCRITTSSGDIKITLE